MFWPEKSSWEMRAPEAMTGRKLNNEELKDSTEGKDLITKWCGDRDEGGCRERGLRIPGLFWMLRQMANLFTKVGNT